MAKATIATSSARPLEPAEAEAEGAVGWENPGDGVVPMLARMFAKRLGAHAALGSEMRGSTEAASENKGADPTRQWNSNTSLEVTFLVDAVRSAARRPDH